MSLVGFAGGWLLVLTLAVAAVAKVRSPRQLRHTLEVAGVPQRARPLIAVALPALEAAAAVALLVPALTGLAAVGVPLLMWSFTAFAAVAVHRGLDVSCGCFGELDSAPMTWRTVARNAALTLLAVVVAMELRGQPAGLWRLPEVSAADLVGVAAVLGVVGYSLQPVWYAPARRLLGRGGSASASAAAAPGERARTGTPAAVPAPRHAAAASRTETAALVDIPLRDAAGQAVTLREHLPFGRPALLLMLRPDCGGCQALLPQVREWQRRATGLSLVVVSEVQDGTQAMLEDPELPPVLLEHGRALSAATGVRRTPAAVLLGTDGTIEGEPAAGTQAVLTLAGQVLPPAAAGEARPPAHARRGIVAPAAPATAAPAQPAQSGAPSGPASRVGPAAAGVTTAELDGELSVWSPATGRYLSLNHSAGDVWLLSDGEHTVEEMVSLLARGYGRDEAEIRDQVLETVELFQREGLLRRDGDAVSA